MDAALREPKLHLLMLQPVRLYAFLLKFLARLLLQSKKVSLIISKSLIFIQGKLPAPHAANAHDHCGLRG
jgi:hypothetical protein